MKKIDFDDFMKLDIASRKEYLQDIFNGNNFLEVVIDALFDYEKNGCVLNGFGYLLTDEQKEYCEMLGFKVVEANEQHALRIYHPKRMFFSLFNIEGLL